MRLKILACITICILAIAGVAMAQRTSEVSEMKDPSTWDSEMGSLGLPPLKEIQRKVGRAIHRMDPFLVDLEEGYWHGWKARGYPEGDKFVWAYHYVGSAPHTFSGEIVDYGDHDDQYIAAWFEYPSWEYKYVILEPGQSSVTTPEYTLDSDHQVVLMWQRNHTSETTDWDWFVNTTHLESAPPATEYWAVIIGIEDYMYIDDCAYADNDAKDIYDRLLSYPNWDKDHVKLLVDRDATKANIKAAIDWMKTSSDEDDVCLFHFSGHGTHGTDVSPYDEADEIDEYICTADMIYLGDAIRDDELDDWLTPIEANKVVMLDSCFSGGAIKAGVNIRTMPSVPFVKLTDGFVRDLDKAGYVVLTASDDDEVAYGFGPPFENGIFTYFVDKGLAGLADADGDGDISAEEAYAYTEPKIVSYTGDKQHPQIYDGVTGELPIAK